MARWWPFVSAKIRSRAEGAEVAEKKLHSFFRSVCSALSALKSPAGRPGRPGRAGGRRSRAEGAENAEKRKKKKKNFFAFLRGLCGLCARRPSPASPAKALGNRGETAACRCLKKAGMKILARNYRCPGGEIDIIALDPSTRRTSQAETIVFVEVKTRASETPAGPASAIDAHKRKQVVQAGRYYLRHHPAKGYLTRYDAVAVIIPPGQKPTVRHIPNAF